MPFENRSTAITRGNAGEESSISDRSVGPDNHSGDIGFDDPSERVSKAIDSALAVDHATRATGPGGQQNIGASLMRQLLHDQNARNFAWLAEIPLRSAPTTFPASTFHAIQEWEGYVVEVGPEEFVARLVDLTANSTYEGEEAIVPLEEISEDDANRIRVGSVFRWVIGYERSAAGTKKRVSQFVLRDLPAVTRTDLRDGNTWAQEVVRSLDL